MWRIEQRSLGVLIFCALWLCGCEPPGSQSTAEMWSEPIRVATFNTSLNRPAAGQLANDLRDGNDAQAWQVAAIGMCRSASVTARFTSWYVILLPRSLTDPRIAMGAASDLRLVRGDVRLAW